MRRFRRLKSPQYISNKAVTMRYKPIEAQSLEEP